MAIVKLKRQEDNRMHLNGAVGALSTLLNCMFLPAIAIIGYGVRRWYRLQANHRNHFDRGARLLIILGSVWMAIILVCLYFLNNTFSQ